METQSDHEPTIHSPETRLELDVEKTLIRIGSSGGVFGIGQTLVAFGYELIGVPLIIIGIMGFIYFFYRFMVKENIINQIKI